MDLVGFGEDTEGFKSSSGFDENDPSKTTPTELLDHVIE